MTVIVAIHFKHQGRSHAVVAADSLYTDSETKKATGYTKDKLVAIQPPGPAIITGYCGFVPEIERARTRSQEAWAESRSPYGVVRTIQKEIIKARRDQGRSLSEGRSSALVVGQNRALDDILIYEANAGKSRTVRLETSVVTRGSGAEDANLRLVREGVSLQREEIELRPGKALYLGIAAAQHAKLHCGTVGGPLQILYLHPGRGIFEFPDNRCFAAEETVKNVAIRPSGMIYERLEQLLS